MNFKIIQGDNYNYKIPTNYNNNLVGIKLQETIYDILNIFIKKPETNQIFNFAIFSRRRKLLCIAEADKYAMEQEMQMNM